MIEDKVTLARRRAELVECLAGPLPAEERVSIQGELSVVNAKIKALNTTEAAKLKAAADRRKVAGLAEAQANAGRARANLAIGADDPGDAEDDDPAQTAAIDAWIVAVLQRGGVKSSYIRGNLSAARFDFEAPPKWAAIIAALRAGIHATARGEELPEVTAPEPKAKKRS
jgi:hypothetical protein